MKSLSNDKLSQKIKTKILSEEYEKTIEIFSALKYELFSVLEKHIDVLKEDFKVDVFVLKSGKIAFRFDGIIK